MIVKLFKTNFTINSNSVISLFFSLTLRYLLFSVAYDTKKEWQQRDTFSMEKTCHYILKT